MRGHIPKRYKDTWNIMLDIGYQIVPDTGQQQRVQKWVTGQGTKRDAERKLTELPHNLHRDAWPPPQGIF